MKAHIRTFGSGPRTALALHCTLAHSGAWSPLARCVDGLRLDAMDMLSHGRSSDWDGLDDFHDQATALARPHFDRPMDLIGHSFGATVALRLAAERPENLRSLCLIEPVFFAAALADTPQRVYAHEAEVSAYTQGMADGDFETATRGFNRVWGDGTQWAEISQTTRDYMVQRIHVVPASGPTLNEDRAGLLNPGVLSRITAPCLLIEGGNSPDVVDAVNSALARRLPNVQRAIIQGAGHMVPITHPKEVAAKFRKLLKAAPIEPV